MPDFKTIADFRKDNGKAIRSVCREFIVLCRKLKLFSGAIVAIDGSKFKAVNNRDKNFTDRKLKARMQGHRGFDVGRSELFRAPSLHLHLCFERPPGRAFQGITRITKELSMKKSPAALVREYRL
jgi:hypothetical protein